MTPGLAAARTWRDSVSSRAFRVAAGLTTLDSMSSANESNCSPPGRPEVDRRERPPPVAREVRERRQVPRDDLHPVGVRGLDEARDARAIHDVVPIW